MKQFLFVIFERKNEIHETEDYKQKNELESLFIDTHPSCKGTMDSPCVTDFSWHILAPRNPCSTPGSRHSPENILVPIRKRGSAPKCLLIYTQRECEIDLRPVSISF